MKTPVTIHHGVSIFARTTIHPDGRQQLVYYVPGWIGIWNSEKSAADYIDWRQGGWQGIDQKG